MLLLQTYHSVHDIDPEFIPSIELLLQEDIPHFTTLLERHDQAPTTDVFTYFLFFGPTQNTPIGFSQLCLRKIPYDNLYPRWKRIVFFWQKHYKQWKQLTWRISDGSQGLCVFDPKFARSGKEKVQELMKEFDQRREVEAQQIIAVKGLQEFQVSWPQPPVHSKECYVLEPLFKSVKSYEAYLSGLRSEVRQQIKASWKNLNRSSDIKLGEYAKASEISKHLPIDEKQLAAWEKAQAQILTFESKDTVLGCLLVSKGKNGNVFIEPFPFEPQEGSIVSDDLYTQYALLKFFEMPEARKCHLMKFGAKLIFEDKEDLTFFLDQGFQIKTLTQTFYSRLPNLLHPV